jgi:energy-coupling factor transporter ATP-binding protein EcfA2
MSHAVDLIITLGSLKSIEFASIGEVNVIIGPNNSGKTTFLRAIGDPSNWMTQASPQREVVQRIDRVRLLNDGSVKFYVPSVPVNRDLASNQWYTGETNVKQALLSQRERDEFSAVKTSLNRASLRLKRKLQYLWHRRKSAYKAPYGPVHQLDPEATNMAGRLAYILAAEKRLSDSIDKFVSEVIPGCPGFTVKAVKPDVTAEAAMQQIYVGDYPLEAVGGGVEQTLAIAIALIAEDPKCNLLIEEPETNLHPSSQRTLVRKIMELRQDRTIFITTHSPVILNEIARYEGVNVYRIWPNMAEGEKITPSQTTSNFRDALDGIGARPSDILQANCVVWVEGPTEAIVLRHLIELYYPDRYVEHTDMEFMFTGGSSIAHMGSEDGRLIDVLRMCRNAFLLFDRDAPVSEPMNRKGRPDLRTVRHVSQHVTWGYEFEWYYPEPVVAELFKKVDAKQLFGPDKGSKPFYKALHEAGGPAAPSKAETAQKIVATMNALEREKAKQLWSEGLAGTDLEKLLDDIVGAIERSRADVGLPSITPPNP